MGGKTGTTTQTVQIPPEVLARYNAVNLRAEDVASTPFQQYSTSPNAFVAGLSPTQQAGIGQTVGSMNLAQPAYQAAMAGTGQAYQGFNAPNFQQGVAGYMSPYLENAMGSTAAYLANQQAQQRQELLGNTIAQGAFGGDRGKIAQAALMGQQNLATGQLLGQMAQQGYSDAARNYMAGLGQQGALASQMGQLGAGAQTAGLQGGAAAMAAGQPEQQTQQAGLTALYNQFLQERAYPFQVAQFLGNLAMGTGALSGSTTTTTQPLGFFSDERLKEDIEPIGKTFDGQNIIKFRYKDRPETHIGLSAQETEKRHPEAVGLLAGYKTVDYDKATKDAASMGGGVSPANARQNYEMGGVPYASLGDGIPRALDIPMSAPAIRALALPAAPSPLKSGLSEMSDIAGLASMGMKGYDWYKDPSHTWNKSAKDLDENADRWEKAKGGLVPDEEDKTPQGISEPIKGLDIPNERPDMSSLPRPGQPPQMKSGMSDLSDLATIASVGMKAAPMVGEALSWLPMLFLASGGVAGERRRHRLLGGTDDKATVITDETPDEGLAAADTTIKASIEPTFENIMEASRRGIKRLESGGDYSIKGKPTMRKDPATGATYEDVPLGAYQVMRSNLPSWSKEVLGKEISEDEFLANKDAQDAIFNAKFGQSLRKHGNPLDAASVWFSGRPLKDAVSAGDNPDILGTKPSSYVDAFAQYSGLGAAKAPTVEPAAERKAPSEGGLGEMMSSFLPESNEAKLALLAGVFGALGSPNPTLLGAIGQGGLAGIKTYSELTKLRNESMKYNMEMIKDRFVTIDGQTYQDRWGIMPPMSREQMGAYVRQTLSRSGIGGGLAVPSELKVEAPTLETTAPPAVSKAVDTAKTVTPEAKPETTEPTKSVEEAGQSAGQSLDFSKAKSETEIKQMILNNPDSWKGVDNNLNPRWLYDQAAKQREAMQAYQAQAAAAATNPFGQANVEKLKTLAENARIAMDDYNKRADAALTSASASAIAEFNKMNELSRETTEVIDPVTGAKRTITKAEQVRLSRKGESPMVEQPPAIVKRLEEIAADDAKLREAAVKRPKMRAALDAIAGLLERFETGRFADIKADAVGYLVGLGVPIDPKVAQNTTSMDELIKYANTQTLAMMSQLGAKFTNMELSNISQTVSGAKITPEANAEIVASALAAADADDKIWNDYLTWREKNPNDPFPDAHFEKPWLEANKSFLSDRKKEYLKKIAPKGMQLPPPNDPSKWVDGKRYNTPKGIFIWNAEKGRLMPEGAQ